MAILIIDTIVIIAYIMLVFKNIIFVFKNIMFTSKNKKAGDYIGKVSPNPVL